VGAAASAARESRKQSAEIAELGRAILEESTAIAARFVAGLREDPATFANVERLSDVQLQNHLQTGLADISQALMILQSTSGDPSELMRDTTEIQRVVAERHGVQRQRLGWSEAALSREFQILRHAIDEALAARSDLHVGREARALMEGFIEQLEQTSLRALRHAIRTSVAGATA
jgi:hypothetical protein